MMITLKNFALCILVATSLAQSSFADDLCKKFDPRPFTSSESWYGPTDHLGNATIYITKSSTGQGVSYFCDWGPGLCHFGEQNFTKTCTSDGQTATLLLNGSIVGAVNAKVILKANDLTHVDVTIAGDSIATGHGVLELQD